MNEINYVIQKTKIASLEAELKEKQDSNEMNHVIQKNKIAALEAEPKKKQNN